MGATFEDLVAIEDIGEKIAQSIERYLKESRSIITELLAAGLDPPEGISETVGAALAGKTFVITGTLSAPRGEIKALILRNGGTVTGSVTGKSDFLIAGSNVGVTKTAKAESLGVKVISEEDLLEMIEE